MFFIIVFIVYLDVIQGRRMITDLWHSRYTGRMTIKGGPCRFPFKFRDVVYKDCAPGINQPLPWCATSTKYPTIGASHKNPRTVDDWEVCAPFKSTHDRASYFWPYEMSMFPHHIWTQADPYFGRPIQVIDDKICKSLNQVDCNRPAIKHICPLTCPTAVQDTFCEFLNIDDCINIAVRTRCPRMCLRGSNMCIPGCVHCKFIGRSCICDRGWTGVLCDELAVCAGRCVQGSCAATGKCICDIGWEGPACNIHQKIIEPLPLVETPVQISEHCKEDNGFLLSGQCFKPFFDKTRSWSEANLKCQSEGLILAEPSDSSAVALRKYILDTYETTDNDHELWLGAKSDGVKFVWQTSGNTLLEESLLWDHYSSELGRCLELDVYGKEYKDTPNQPYDSASCFTKQLTLCQGFDPV